MIKKEPNIQLSFNFSQNIFWSWSYSKNYVLHFVALEHK